MTVEKQYVPAVLDLPLTVVERGSRVLIVRARPLANRQPVLEVLPYSTLATPMQVGAMVAARLNFYPNLVESVRMFVSAGARAPRMLTPAQRAALVNGNNLLNAIEGI